MSKPGAAIRSHLVDALQADLIGPYSLDMAATEVLPIPPSRWYLTGFLAPKSAREREQDPTDDDELAAGNADDDEGEETSGTQDGQPRAKLRAPASIGLSVLLPPGSTSDVVAVTLRWADYALVEPETDAQANRPEGGKRRQVWKRLAIPAKRVVLALEPEGIREGVRVDDTVGVWIGGTLREAEANGLEPGTRALSMFVVNERPPAERGRGDTQFMFQVELELEFAGGIVARPDLRSGQLHRDELLADLQFRACFEWAIGHGAAVEVPEGQAPVTRVKTTWLPKARVRRVVTLDETQTECAMEELAKPDDPARLVAALRPLASEYEVWIRGLADETKHPLAGGRREVRDDIVRFEAEQARQRILAGIALLERDPVARRAFELANEAMAMAARQRSPGRYAQPSQRPSWRLFQLAFVLLSLPGIVDPQHDDREIVDLIFFPTGGGKTEAYLGVIAFTLALRRLRGRERSDQGLGVAVLLRYTLRLLTLDQLGRASTLICALELLRQRQPDQLGELRFAVGLWVGKSATANTLREIAMKSELYRAGQTKDWPCPLSECPWCRVPLDSSSLDLRPTPEQPRELVLGCTSETCPFCVANDPLGLPVLFVDEQIYAELPCFVVATVDKFAMLPWRGETGKLFGRVSAREGRNFVAQHESPPRGAIMLSEGLEPPELIVQDELHLISGPLGTMVGLYETALDWLASTLREQTKDGVRTLEVVAKPKIIAATATVRRAAEQIRALFGRNDTRQFPPPGIDDQQTWFAQLDENLDHARLYVGVAAPGRSMKAILLRTYAALLAAAWHEYERTDPADQPADAYTTLVGYFNALRELGGMRRLVDDDVHTRCASADERRPLDVQGPHRWQRNRMLGRNPVELTSRRPTSELNAAKVRMGRPYAEPLPIDVVLASNMISVGVDIDRLGLMVIAGQPKTSAEYIQASSRVGRQPQWPGLVVTCFNVARPRDRSHYERFTAYHEQFYRFVEAPSLTPFSGPALDRGLAGTLVAMARLVRSELSGGTDAGLVGEHRWIAEEGVKALVRRAASQSPDRAQAEGRGEAVRARARDLLDAWEHVHREATDDGTRFRYSRYDPRGRTEPVGSTLLFGVLDEPRPPVNSEHGKFAAATSMREVESTVHLWLRKFSLGGEG